jgi:hypothetical protein
MRSTWSARQGHWSRTKDLPRTGPGPPPGHRGPPAVADNPADLRGRCCPVKGQTEGSALGSLSFGKTSRAA